MGGLEPDTVDVLYSPPRPLRHLYLFNRRRLHAVKASLCAARRPHGGEITGSTESLQLFPEKIFARETRMLLIYGLITRTAPLTRRREPSYGYRFSCRRGLSRLSPFSPQSYHKNSANPLESWSPLAFFSPSDLPRVTRRPNRFSLLLGG
ncbi:hypothetical protein JAAARDRAFT_470246 [Jaapia argillacea MUCL 33604]|uniref:Uncharacterized protein n=1 Tax=Jaapia argillacea MUCL 33604 TaxID=933084 RepID=A0A067Q9A5_9AGAM|nr:hypothetical protein JAAARDRAFT_470246 [Jaapia argillacea MUCL 33604]